MVRAWVSYAPRCVPVGCRAAGAQQSQLASARVTSVTTIARYYSFYWALAEFAGPRELDPSACRELVRNAEVALAWASALDPDSGNLTGAARMHGADAVIRLLKQGRAEHLAKVGPAPTRIGRGDFGHSMADPAWCSRSPRPRAMRLDPVRARAHRQSSRCTSSYYTNVPSDLQTPTTSPTT